MTDTEMSHQHLSLNIIKGTLLKANTSVFFSYRECVLSQKEIIKKRRNNKRERESVCVFLCIAIASYKHCNSDSRKQQRDKGGV